MGCQEVLLSNRALPGADCEAGQLTRTQVVVFHGSKRTADAAELARADVVLTTYAIIEGEHRRYCQEDRCAACLTPLFCARCPVPCVACCSDDVELPLTRADERSTSRVYARRFMPAASHAHTASSCKWLTLPSAFFVSGASFSYKGKMCG